MKNNILLNSDEITLAVNRISLQVLEKNHSPDNIAIVGIHTCGVFLAERIRKFIEQQTSQVVPYGSLDINLYPVICPDLFAFYHSVTTAY